MLVAYCNTCCCLSLFFLHFWWSWSSFSFSGRSARCSSEWWQATLRAHSDWSCGGLTSAVGPACPLHGFLHLSITIEHGLGELRLLVLLAVGQCYFPLFPPLLPFSVLLSLCCCFCSGTSSWRLFGYFLEAFCRYCVGCNDRRVSSNKKVGCPDTRIGLLK